MLYYVKSMVKEKEPQLAGKNKTDWQALEKQYLMQTVKRVPVTLARGRGARVWDDEGKEYLDFVGGWAVNSLGHCHPVVVKAIAEQSKLLIHTSNQFYTIPQVQLAQLLINNSCLDRAFLCNSGTEANESAAKLARRYGKIKMSGAYQIITTHNSFHGRTLAMVAATGQHKFQEPYAPLPEGFVNVNFDDIDSIKKATTEKTCAVMVEPIQGEGGVNVPKQGYFQELRSWCDQKGILLILDEIQTGVGRTGTLFLYEQFDIEPDMITLAKGLGGGIPIGALLAKDKASVFQPGEHGTTFGGNPLACATSLATMMFIIDKGISANAKMVGDYFITGMNKLKAKYDFITEIRGRGLLLAMVFNQEIAGELVISCLKKGLLINQVKPNIIRFMPPLIITNEDVDKGLSILDNVLNER
jgi:acetylornithine/N-succinyldiaminopimelate aminotransferase